MPVGPAPRRELFILCVRVRVCVCVKKLLHCLMGSAVAPAAAVAAATHRVAVLLVLAMGVGLALTQCLHRS